MRGGIEKRRLPRCTKFRNEINYPLYLPTMSWSHGYASCCGNCCMVSFTSHRVNSILVIPDGEKGKIDEYG